MALAIWLARYGVGWEAFAASGALAVLAAVSAVDLESRRIPNVLVLPATALTLALLAALAPEQLAEAAIAAGATYLFFFVPAFLAPRLLGMGDAKLGMFIGALLGREVLSALLLASLSVGVAAAGVLVLGGAAARRTALPFGPFLAGAAAVMLVASGGSFYP